MKKGTSTLTKFILILQILTSLSGSSTLWAASTQKSIQRGQTTYIKSSSLKKSFPKELDSYAVENLTSEYSSWGISPKVHGSINLEKAWSFYKKLDVQGTSKKDIVVAVIDTGIDYEHSFLKNNLYIPNGKVSKNNYGLDFSKKRSTKAGIKADFTVTTTPQDTHGHGTHVSGIIKSVFPDVKILALKYYNPEASGQENLESTIKALEYAVDVGVDIINYSGGGPEPSPEELKVLQKAERKGILVVAAAGNEKSNIDHSKNAYYPASYGLSNIITVMAHNQDLTRLPSSNYGKKTVDISAPGYRIRSAIPAPASSTMNTGYMTGTSQATAFVTGTAALIKARWPEFSAPKVRALIMAGANGNLKVTPNIQEQIKKENAAEGILDAYQALVLASKEASRDEVGSRKLANFKEIKSSAGQDTKKTRPIKNQKK